MEHVLIVLISAFLLYHFMGRCSCGNGFSIGNEYYDPKYIQKYDDVWYGCDAALNTNVYKIPCPFNSVGTTSKPPEKPNNPSNPVVWRCKKNSWYEDDKCESTNR